jgi:NitT/TauT family transport system substrate-binding protein
MTARGSTKPLAALAALTLVLSACGQSGSAGSGGADGKTIRVELFCTGVAPIAAELAINSGVAEKHDLKIEPMCVSSGSTATQALIGGSADVFMGDIGHVALARKRGAKLRAYAVANDRFTYLMVARKDANVNSVSDLKGKQVAVTAPGTLSHTELKKAAMDAGLNPESDLTVVNGGAGATMQGTLNTGQVVAGMTSQPDTQLLLKTGDFKILWDPQDYRYVDIIAMANEDWVAEHQDLMKKFIAAMDDASKQAKADPAKAVEWMKKQGYKISDEDLGVIVQEAVQNIPDGLRVPDSVFESSGDVLIRTGLVEAPLPSIQDMFDGSLLPAQ